MTTPSMFFHSGVSDGECITFSLNDRGISSVPKFVYHSTIICPHNTNLRGRIFKDDKLIVLHPPRILLCNAQIQSLHEFIQKYKAEKYKIFIGTYTADDFKKLPRYSLEYIEKVLTDTDVTSVIDMHICNPIVKNFIKRSYL